MLANRMLMAAAGVGGVVTRTFVDLYANATNGASSTIAIAPANPAGNRKILVLVWARDDQAATPTISSMTVLGETASELATVSTANNVSAAWIATVPTGTSGNVVINFSTEIERTGISVYEVFGASSTAHDTLTDSGSDPLTGTIDVVAGGAIFGMAGVGGGGPTFTWTGITEDDEQTIESDERASCASDEFAAADTGRTIECNPSAGAASNMSMVVVSLQPGS